MISRYRVPHIQHVDTPGMSRSTPGMHGARRQSWLALVLSIALSVAVCPRAEAAEPVIGQAPVPAEKGASKDAEDAKTPKFSPAVEKKLEEFFAKTKEALIKFNMEAMDKTIAEVVKVTGLDEKGKQALSEPARTATEASVTAALPRLEALMRKQFKRQPLAIEQMIDQMLPQFETVARSGFGGEIEMDPKDHEAWGSGLARTLTAEQLAAWNKVEAERKAVVRKELEGVLAASIDALRVQFEQEMISKSEEIGQSLELPQDRREKLDQAAKTLAENVSKLEVSRLERMLLSMPELQRKQVVKQGRLYVAPDENSQKQLDASWQEQLAMVLTPDELKLVSSSATENRARRTHAFAAALIALLDERVAFTSEQRKRLQPIAERVVGEQDEFFPKAAGANQYVNFSRQVFYMAASEVTDDELGAILEPAQVKRWREACDPKNQSGIAPVRLHNPNAESAKKEEPEPILEPEEVEHAISDYLVEKAEAERERLASVLTLKVEDAARVVGLGAQAVAQLETAALGAAEAALVSWKSSTDQNIHSQLAQLNPQQVRKRLASMDSYSYSRSNVELEKQGIWEKTVKIVLTEPQLAAWNEQVAQRAAFQGSTAAMVILAEFDRKFPITAEQWAKLEPLLAKFMKDYGPDVARMFSPNNSTAWFMQTYSMFMPFAAIPEKEMEGILTKRQLERLKGSNEFSNANNYWENVQQMHQQRVKAK